MGDNVFEERTRLKDLIVAILEEEETASISGIQKRLTRHGEDLHRLVVTGYLRALADTGLLEARSLPPSKVYRLKAGPGRRGIHDEAGRAVAARDLPRGTEAKVLVALLARLFHRPVFKAEVERAGFEAVGLSDWEVETKDRQTARQRVAQAGIELPHNNPAYYPPDPVDEEVRTHIEDILVELVVKGYNAQPFVQRGKQITLQEM
jgi:hypothetical protein